MTKDDKPDRMSPGQAALAIENTERLINQGAIPPYPIITPLVFSQVMQTYKETADPLELTGTLQEKAFYLMCVTLRSLGYGEGVDLISKEREDEI